jgi:hypothetical protein
VLSVGYLVDMVGPVGIVGAFEVVDSSVGQIGDCIELEVGLEVGLVLGRAGRVLVVVIVAVENTIQAGSGIDHEGSMQAAIESSLAFAYAVQHCLVVDIPAEPLVLEVVVAGRPEESTRQQLLEVVH